MTDTKQNDSFVSKEAIKASPLGEELSDAQCALLAGVATACGIKDGAFLIDEGGKDDALYVISSGRLEAVTRGSDEGYITLQLLIEGDMVGELGFIDAVEHSAGLRALGNCELIRLDRASFERLNEQDPELVYKVMRAIMRTVHRILRRMNTQYVELSNYISKQHGRY